MSEKPAFPIVYVDLITEFQVYEPGMSLRDWFAGQALIGLTSNLSGTRHTKAWLVSFAYQTADAMITERDKPTNGGNQ